MSVPALFSMSLAGPIDAAALDELIGWPESSQVEFKREIPGSGSAPDPWAGGGDYSPAGRDKIFKEVIALANTSGGHLFLGIAENKQKPPAGDAIAPIRDCHDLAERLSKAAQGIDPVIPGLQIVPIETDPSGAGVIVFRVPASRAAPHRGLNKEAYIRRGTESVPMSMREIHDLVLAGATREGQMELSFEKAALRFQEFMTRLYDGSNGQVVPGFRVTAVPTMPLSLPRLYGNKGVSAPTGPFQVLVGSRSDRAHTETLGRPRAILRGVEYSTDYSDGAVRLRLFQDGSIESEFCPGQKDRLYSAWIIANVIRAAQSAQSLRELGGMPDLEYLFETEISALPVGAPTSLYGWNHSLGQDISELPLPVILPRVSFGPVGELDSLITQINTDLTDAAGLGSTKPYVLKLQP